MFRWSLNRIGEIFRRGRGKVDRLIINRVRSLVRINRCPIKSVFSYSNKCRRLRHDQVEVDLAEGNNEV